MEGLSYLNDERFYSPIFCSLSPSLSFPQSSGEALWKASLPWAIQPCWWQAARLLLCNRCLPLFSMSLGTHGMCVPWSDAGMFYISSITPHGWYCNFLFKANIVLLKCIQEGNILPPFKLLYNTVLYTWLAIYFSILLISIWDSPLYSVLTKKSHVTVNIALWCIWAKPPYQHHGGVADLYVNVYIQFIGCCQFFLQRQKFTLSSLTNKSASSLMLFPFFRNASFLLLAF